jgi:transcriptional regulator with XRE-family HTH domain
MPSSLDHDAQRLVKQARLALGLTQTEFAEHLGVSKRTIIRWENAISYTAHAYLMAVAKLVQKAQPALSGELRSTATGIAESLGIPRSHMENLPPMLASLEVRTAQAMVSSAATALGVPEEAFTRVLSALLEAADQKRFSLRRFRRALVPR